MMDTSLRESQNGRRKKRPKKGRDKAALTVALILVVCVLAQCSRTRFPAPASDLSPSDLVGCWKAKYWILGKPDDVDTLILRGDGTFKQVYKSYVENNGYAFQTPWQRWWLEQLSDGRVWLHLEGAEYFMGGVRFAEQGGLHAPCPEDWPDCRMGEDPPPWDFYDPYGSEFLEMIGELVVNVRSEASHELVLHHMWQTADRGFAAIGGEMEVFRRCEGR